MKSLVVVVSLIVGTGVLATTAQAQNGQVPPGAEVAAEHRRIVDFWTPEQRASAVPRDVVRATPRAKPGTPGGGGGGGGGGGTTSVTGATWTQGGTVVSTTGKVFFTMGSTRYTCSGSVVDSAHGSLVLTAGHCVHDITLGFATNWIFYPAYNGNPSPTLGSWTATSLFTTSDWANAQDFDDDAGFAVVTGGDANTLEGRLAGAGISSVPPIEFSTATDTHHAFGYPASKKYKGSALTYCAGAVRIGAYDGAQTFSMACDMTGGSSGGPWFRAFANGTGTIHSLNSYGYASLRNVMFGPVLDAPEQAAFSAANSSPSCTASAAVPCTAA